MTPLPDNQTLDRQLPSPSEKDLLESLTAQTPRSVSGARDTPEQALANLLTALAKLGLIKDSTTET